MIIILASALIGFGIIIYQQSKAIILYRRAYDIIKYEREQYEIELKTLRNEKEGNSGTAILDSESSSKGKAAKSGISEITPKK